MSSFLLQKRSITVYKSQLYRIMWQGTWLMYCFEELRITLWENIHFSPVSYFRHNLSPSLDILILNGLFLMNKVLREFCSESKVLKSDTTETKSILCSLQPNFLFALPFKNWSYDPNFKLYHMFQKLLFAKAHPARPRVKNRHQGNLEVVQVCCWLAPYGRSIEASLLWSSISTDVVGEQIYNRLVLGFFGWIQIRC